MQETSMPGHPDPAEPDHPATSDRRAEPADTARPTPPPRPRPLIERIGMAAVALVLAILFGTVAVAAFASGELFLAVMGAIGTGMTVWVGGMTLFRG
jgi:hypothetical protein